MTLNLAYFLLIALAVSWPLQPPIGSNNEPEMGEVSSSTESLRIDSEAGAAGPDKSSVALNREGVIAISAISACICVFGVISAILFYHAKKKDWQIRENFKKSAKRVAIALTPCRSSFPKDEPKNTEGLD
ncbi:hypothetical protein GcM3_070007 [Golovinomyces cichoracearum]|uniref:Uncharacterized protein n=1 Tax=Golovinomyces cichoracearum TaxID=62708 RepID=A0A420IT18_9PEZI|nr:hypothetical protein GcM3_070007 [Golovinomyces cichoracearum]